MALPYQELWAKKHGLDRPYPLPAHLLDSAAFAGELYDAWLRPEIRALIETQLGSCARGIVMWLVGIHDVGKANPVFQGQLASGYGQDVWQAVRASIEGEGRVNFNIPHSQESLVTEPYCRRHEQVSASYLIGAVEIQPYAVEHWKAIPSLGHHGKFSAPIPSDMDDMRGMECWQKLLDQNGWVSAQGTLDSMLREVCGVPDELPIEVATHIMVFIGGITIIADRLASNLEWVRRSQQDLDNQHDATDSSRAWFEHQRDQALAVIKKELGIYHGWADSTSARNDILGDKKPRPVQEIAENDCAGLLTIMAATGSGKTEAALLRHAAKDERLIFLLPTMATSNALMKRVQRAFLKTQNTGALAHSMATIEDFYDAALTAFHGTCEHGDSGGLIPSAFVRSGLERLLASVTVGTIDQALKSALPVKWVHLVLTALANAHVVIDEVHALDAYQIELLKSLLKWLGMFNTRVTLLSATLSQKQCKELIRAYTEKEIESPVAFPAVVKEQTSIPLDQSTYTIDYVLNSVAPDDIVNSHVEWVLDQRTKYPRARVGVICNRVDRAKSVAEQLAAQGEKVHVLHARMSAGHRQVVADNLLSMIGPDGDDEAVCVVGTQAIEASLDIDLDLLSTDLCPSASLIQRAGRVWRREDAQRVQRVEGVGSAFLHIVEANNYDTRENLPYPVALLKRTAGWLRSHQNVRVPEDCQDFVDVCTLSFNDLKDEFEIEAASEEVRKSNVAKHRIFNLEDILSDDGSLGELSCLTNSGVSIDELQTRLIDDPTFRAILVSDECLPGVISHQEAKQLCDEIPTHDAIRRAMRASVNIRQEFFAKDKSRFLDLQPKSTFLDQFEFVDVTGIYDPLTGLDLVRGMGGYF